MKYRMKKLPLRLMQNNIARRPIFTNLILTDISWKRMLTIKNIYGTSSETEFHVNIEFKDFDSYVPDGGTKHNYERMSIRDSLGFLWIYLFGEKIKE